MRNRGLSTTVRSFARARSGLLAASAALLETCWVAPAGAEPHAEPLELLSIGDEAPKNEAPALGPQLLGQPARRETWNDPAIDARFGGCYAATLATMEQCWTRPRFKGYLRFQAKGGDLIERHLRGAMSEGAMLDALQREFEAAGQPL